MASNVAKTFTSYLPIFICELSVTQVVMFLVMEFTHLDLSS